MSEDTREMGGDKWTRGKGSGHPLAELEGKPLVDAHLVVTLGPQNRYGARYFQITLRDGTGTESQPVLLALHQSGSYPSANWIEVIKTSRKLRFPQREIALSEADLGSLFGYLSDLIPPGGHMMVEYDSDEWEDTRLSIGCGIPYVATRLGSTLFWAGCGIAFKDWYFAEGGSEGPRKLQGYRALDEQHVRARAVEMAGQLRAFVHGEGPAGCHQLWEAAQKRATEVLSLLSTIEALSEGP